MAQIRKLNLEEEKKKIEKMNPLEALLYVSEIIRPILKKIKEEEQAQREKINLEDKRNIAKCG